MKLHICLTCLHSHDFQKPLSMTIGGIHFHMCFECLFTPYIDAYGHKVDTNPMIYDMITGDCWADGSSNVPKNGCVNYKKIKNITDEVINYIKE